MSDNETESEIICHCSGTSRAKIDSLIEQGIVTLDEISRKTGAAAGCGGCDYDIEQILAEYHQQEENSHS